MVLDQHQAQFDVPKPQPNGHDTISRSPSQIKSELSSLETETQERRQIEALRIHANDLLELLSQPDVEDVAVNPDGTLWTNRLHGGFQKTGQFPANRTRLILSQVASLKNAEFGHTHPILETDFPLDGSRITGLVSPIVRGAALALRAHPKRSFQISDYVERGIVTHKGDPQNEHRHHDRFLDTIRGVSHAEVIRKAIEYRRNILTVGATGSGKTTFTNMLLNLVAATCPNDRIVTIEDTKELDLSAIRNHVSLLSTTHVSMARCLKASLRLQPHRIVVGEVRDADAWILLNAWNTGHSGGLATVHANEALSGLQRLEELLPKVRPRDARSIIARAVNVVMFIDQDDEIQARRKLREILIVKGYNRAKDSYEVEYV